MIGQGLPAMILLEVNCKFAFSLLFGAERLDFMICILGILFFFLENLVRVIHLKLIGNIYIVHRYNKVTNKYNIMKLQYYIQELYFVHSQFL